MLKGEENKKFSFIQYTFKRLDACFKMKWKFDEEICLL